jgi:hypothetical protein
VRFRQHPNTDIVAIRLFRKIPPIPSLKQRWPEFLMVHLKLTMAASNIVTIT